MFLNFFPCVYNVVTTIAPSFMILAGNKDSHKSLDEFEIRSGTTIDCSKLPLCVWKNPLDFQWEK